MGLQSGWKASEWMENFPKVGNMTKYSPISPLLTVATQDFVYFAIAGKLDLVPNELLDRHASF